MGIHTPLTDRCQSQISYHFTICTPASRVNNINKESVRLFVSPTEGCGKTLTMITMQYPHTRIDMGYRHTEKFCTPSHNLNKNECRPYRPIVIENFHIFSKGQCENTFICKSLGYSQKTLQRYEITFHKQHSYFGILH